MLDAESGVLASIEREVLIRGDGIFWMGRWGRDER